MSDKISNSTELVQQTMNSVMQSQTEQKKVSIEARQEFKQSFQSSYEEEWEEETHIDEFGNESTVRKEQSSESQESSKSAKVQVKASGLNAEQVQALTQASNELGNTLAGQDNLALQDKSGE